MKKLTADIDGVIVRAGNTTIQAKIGDLQKDDLKLVGLDQKNDASAAAGMLIATELDCTLEQVEQLVIATNQTELYPGTYDAYKRTYKSSSQDYLARKSDKVEWQTEYTASVLSRQYAAVISAANHYYAHGGPNGGPTFLSRAFLTTPAQFLKGGDDSAFKQDYQIEIYYTRPSGKVVHFYAVWRQFNVGTIDSRNSLYQSIVLGNLVDFDKRTSKICRDKTPTPKFD
jgi:hypothetical protein